MNVFSLLNTLLLPFKEETLLMSLPFALMVVKFDHCVWANGLISEILLLSTLIEVKFFHVAPGPLVELEIGEMSEIWLFEAFKLVKLIHWCWKFFSGVKSWIKLELTFNSWSCDQSTFSTGVKSEIELLVIIMCLTFGIEMLFKNERSLMLLFEKSR